MPMAAGDRFLDAILLKLGIARLRQAGLRKTYHFGSFEPKKSSEIRRGVVLHDRVVREVRQNFGAAAFRQVVRDQNKVQFALAAQECLASDQQNARPDYERKQP